MKHIRILSLLLVFVITKANCQQIDTVKLKSQATTLAQTFINGDYKLFVKYTYPKVVQLMGGEDKMIEFLTSMTVKLKKEGIEYKSVDIGLTSLNVKAGEEIHTLVLETIIMTVPGGTLTANSYLLAISKDQGNNWYFVDTAAFQDEQKLNAIFPNYNSQLKIPSKQPQTFIRTE